MAVRIERDSLGEVAVPAERYWGAQTERSLRNFKIGLEKIPLEVIHALVLVKKAAAIANYELGVLEEEKKTLISAVCDEILEGRYDDQFPLSVWQTGSGTQTNMNVNEVIANLAIEKRGGEIGSKHPVHPNDDVNRSQSSNDAFPTAMHVSAKLAIRHFLLPNLEAMREALNRKAISFSNIVKVGRTHLMDAAPLTLGQEFSGYVSQLDHGISALNQTLIHLSEIALGGTAVGTGINAPKNYSQRAAEIISELSGEQFVSASNKFEALASHDALVEVSGALKRIAVSFLKIANDIRWMNSGPRCGLGELKIPENEPGSSIMPGKINPTQCEALAMLSVQVMGNDVTIGIAGSQGNFELNVFKPVMISNLIQSIRLLSDGAANFTKKCIEGIEPNEEEIKAKLGRSLMLATILNHEIGYDAASKIVRKAHLEGTSLKAAAAELGFLSEEQYDALVDPKKMI